MITVQLVHVPEIEIKMNMYLQMKNFIVFTKSTQVLKQACSNGIWETIETFPGG